MGTLYPKTFESGECCRVNDFFSNPDIFPPAILDVTKTGNGERGTGNGERGTGNGERGTGNGKRGTGNGERGTRNGERGTGNGERGTGNGERGTGVWERVYSGNPPENSKWRRKRRLQTLILYCQVAVCSVIRRLAFI